MRILVTGGGTQAPIDDVRQITNTSTGRFSAALSEACLVRGAEVWHLHAPTAELPILRHARLDRALASSDLPTLRARLETAYAAWAEHSHRLHLIPAGDGTVADYTEALRSILVREPIDIAFLAMAVSDFEPERSPGKLSSDLSALSLRLRPTPKVIRWVKDWAPGVFLVGFKLLSNVPEADLLAAAASSGAASRADLVVGNDLALYRSGGHVLHVVQPPEPVSLRRMGPGGDVAAELVDFVLHRVGAGLVPPSSSG